MLQRMACIETHGPIVYAPESTRRQPALRVSFGAQSRMTKAAARRRQACAETFALI